MASGNEAVTVKQLAVALGVKPAEPLPEGYTRLEYIESDGGQYIDTGFKPDDQTRVRAVFDCVDTNNTVVFGARPKANNSELFFLLHAQDTNSFRDNWGTDKKAVPTSSVPTSGTVTVDKDKNKTVFNGSYTVEHPSSTWSSQYNLYLFAGNNGGELFNPTSIRLRSFEVWDGDEKVRESVPARRYSGHVGLFDVVNNSFFVSEGDSDFIAGPEVPTPDVSNTEGCVVTIKQFKVATAKLSGGGSGGGEDWPDPLPSGYTSLEYIEGTGTQYIDTGYFPCELTRVVTAITPMSGNTTNGVFGGRTDNNASTFSLWCVNGVFRTDFDMNSQHVTTDVRVEAGVRVEVDKDRGTTRLGSKTFTQTGMGFRSANSMHVFAVNPDPQAPRYFRGRIETFSIYESGLLEHELVPARRASDGAVGMYDTVGGVFLANSGTGAFKAGPEGGGEYPPAGLKETVLLDTPSSLHTLYYQRDLSAIRKVVVGYTNMANVNQQFTFTYEGDPTGTHMSKDGYIYITFGIVGEQETLVVRDITGASLIRFDRVTIYEQQ